MDILAPEAHGGLLPLREYVFSIWSAFIMKNRLVKAIWSVFLLLPFANAVNASEILLSCPAEVSGSLFQMQAPSPEWQGFVKPRHLLRGAGFMDGEPSSEAHLKPDSVNRIKDGYIDTWKFEKGHFEDIWLTCLYANGVFSLSKKIDGHFSECSVIYKRDKKTNHVEGIEKIICK